MLDYELYDRGTDDLWCILHGAVWRPRSFHKRCQMQDHASCVYPIAPRRWGVRDWRDDDYGQLADTLYEARRKVKHQTLVLAGFSDGATWVHRFAFPVDARIVVHYAGLWPGSRATLPACFFLGQDDNIGRRVGWFGVDYPRRATYEAAEQYGEPVFEVPGGHSWNPDANTFIRSTVLDRLNVASTQESK